MKVFVKENEKIREMEVVIRCSRMEPGINKLVNHIRQFSIQLPVWKDGEQYQIPLYPVSYTHLDVYKRQSQSMVLRPDSSVKCQMTSLENLWWITLTRGGSTLPVSQSAQAARNWG